MLHYAIQNLCSSEVIRAVLNAWPDSARTVVENDAGTPLHFTLENSENQKVWFSYHGVEVMKLLIEANPEVLLTQCALWQKSPLHIAARYSSFEAFKMIIDACPAALRLRDSDGLCPFLCALIRRESNPQTTLDIMRYIHKHYRQEMIATMDTTAARPLVVYATQNFPSLEVYRLLHDLNPDYVNQVGYRNRSVLSIFLRSQMITPTCFLDPTIEDCLRFLLKVSSQDKISSLASAFANYLQKVSYNQSLVTRLLLNAAPSVDPPLYRDLNYKARRMGLFLAYRAIHGTLEDAKKNMFQRLRDQNIDLLKRVILFM